MNTSCRTIVALTALLVLTMTVESRSSVASGFGEMMTHYEAIRLLLVEDSIGGVSDHAMQIQAEASRLLENRQQDSEGLSTEEAERYESALNEIEAAAQTIAANNDLESVREDYFALTKPMAQFRKLAGDEGTIVAYCSMAEKAWIQAQAELGNPYLGQEMPRCGEIVGEE